jgi:hypothetical protein
LTSFPVGDPYSNHGLASTIFNVIHQSTPSDLTAPLSVTLTPGDYALVIGGVGPQEWLLPVNGADASGVTSDSFIEYLGGTSIVSPLYPRWQSGSDGMRFFIDGEVTATPEPPGMLLGAASLLVGTGLLLRRLRAAHSFNTAATPAIQ